MSVYLTRPFWQGLAERALKTFAQALSSVVMSGATGLLDIDWWQALSVAGLAALGSVLTSVASPEFTAGSEAEPTVPSEPFPQAQTREERQQQEASRSEPLF